MRATILIVEDDADTRGQLVTLLEGEGYAVDVATDGHAALTYLRSRPPPRVVLLKLAISAPDGWRFLAACRAEPRLARIPVIALADAGEALGPAALALGADDLLAKPVSPAALLITAARYRGGPAGAS